MYDKPKRKGRNREMIKTTVQFFVVSTAQENHEALLAEKEMEIEMLKDHIEVLLDEQEMANRSHQTEGKI